MLYVRFIDAVGKEVHHAVAMDEVPKPGSEVVLRQKSYVVQAAPVLHSQVEIIPGTPRFVQSVTVAPKGKNRKTEFKE